MTYRTKCWSCGSSNYKETVSREECFSCGLICDYWARSKGTNEAYDRALATKQENDEDARERHQREWEATNGYYEFYG